MLTDHCAALHRSNIKLACAGSLVAKLLDCSFGVSAEQCAAQSGCEWAEAACYPSGYVVTKPKSLAKLKRQVLALLNGGCVYMFAATARPAHTLNFTSQHVYPAGARGRP
jgi:hypothetical protein